jgi:hypothetical protein
MFGEFLVCLVLYYRRSQPVGPQALGELCVGDSGVFGSFFGEFLVNDNFEGFVC